MYREHGVILTAVGIYSRNTKDMDALKEKEKVEALVTAIPHVLQMHGFYIDKEEKAMRFDAVISFDAEDRSVVYREVCEKVQDAYPGYNVQIAMDIDFNEVD